MTDQSTDINIKLALLIEQTKDIPQIRRDVSDIKIGMGKVETRVSHNESDIATLQKRSDGWNVINSLGVAAAAVIAWLRGG